MLKCGVCFFNHIFISELIIEFNFNIVFKYNSHILSTGKAAIGTYFQEHIMQSISESRLNGVWFYGKGYCGNIHLTFRSGFGVLPEKVPQETKHGMWRK